MIVRYGNRKTHTWFCGSSYIVIHLCVIIEATKCSGRDKRDRVVGLQDKWRLSGIPRTSKKRKPIQQNVVTGKCDSPTCIKKYLVTSNPSLTHSQADEISRDLSFFLHFYKCSTLELNWSRCCNCVKKTVFTTCMGWFFDWTTKVHFNGVFIKQGQKVFLTCHITCHQIWMKNRFTIMSCIF
jgi:hypothetical protein